LPGNCEIALLVDDLPRSLECHHPYHGYRFIYAPQSGMPPPLPSLPWDLHGSFPEECPEGGEGRGWRRRPHENRHGSVLGGLEDMGICMARNAQSYYGTSTHTRMNGYCSISMPMPCAFTGTCPSKKWTSPRFHAFLSPHHTPRQY
jgi:hypothetical protein